MKNYLGFAFVLQTSYMGRKMVIICCTKYWETRYTLKHFATIGKRSQKLNLQLSLETQSSQQFFSFQALKFFSENEKY